MLPCGFDGTPALRSDIARNQFVALSHDRLLIGEFCSSARRHIPLEPTQRFCGMDHYGQRFLLLDEPATNQATIIEVDARGQQHLRFDAAGAIRIDQAAYAPDGISLLFSGSASGPPSTVYWVGVRTTQPREIYQVRQAEQRVVEIKTHARSPTFAVLTQGPMGNAMVLVRRSLVGPPLSVPMPAGVGTLDSFSRDGRVLTVTWETPQGPSEIWEIDTARASARKLRDDSRPTLARLDDLLWEKALIESTTGALEAVVYLPEKRPVDGVVVWLGDAEAVGSWRPDIRYWVGEGMGVIEPLAGGLFSRDTLQGWMKGISRWVQERLGSHRVAMVARSSRWKEALDVALPSSWPLVVSPSPPSQEPICVPNGRDASVLVSVETTNPVSDELVRKLRNAGAHVHYATGDKASRWAREVYFLQTLMTP